MKTMTKYRKVAEPETRPFSLAEKVSANSVFIIIERALGRDQAHKTVFPFPEVIHHNVRCGDAVAVSGFGVVLF